jgi:putative membrane protein
MTNPSGRGAPALSSLSERALAVWVYGLSALVCLLVVALIAFPELLRVQGMDVSALPAFHASLNATTAILLGAGYLLIRAGRITWHRRAMVGAFSLSCVFLLSYVLYHSQAQTSHFGGEGWVRSIYFFILISHIVLAPVVLPLALYAVVRAFRGEFGRHLRVARWTLPIWLYVAVTGVLVYLMMAPYYGT